MAISTATATGTGGTGPASGGTGAPSQQFTTFTLDGHLFGVEVETVQEVIRYQRTTRVPLAAGSIGGLINLRGQVITALDLRHRLGLPDREPGRLPMNVVVRTEDGAVSLLVDQIGAVVETDARHFEAPPDTVSAQARDLIRGAYKLDGTLLLALDVLRTVDL